MANYEKKLRIVVDIRRKGKIEKITEFAEKIKKVQKEVRVVLKKAQEKMKQQAYRGKKEAEVWRVGNKVMLSIKDLVFKERPAKKLVDQYLGPYIINEIISTNVVKLQLPNFIQ